MAKGPGKKFEEDFIKSVPDRCDVTRLKDGGGWSDATNMRFTSNNPCDFIVFSKQFPGANEGVMYKFELKSTAGTSLPYGNIKEHQLKELGESATKGVRCEFVVNFRRYNQTFRVLPYQMQHFMETSDRKSFPYSWFVESGIVIPQTIKISRYKYGLEWL